MEQGTIEEYDRITHMAKPRFFGEYLINRNLICENQLVQALIYQLHELPSIPEIILKMGLMESHVLLEILEIQNWKRCTFVQAAQELGYWTTKISNQIDTHLNSIRLPLGQILVKLGFVTFDQMNQALDQYLSDKTLNIDPNIIGDPMRLGTSQSYFPYLEFFTQSLRERLEASFQLGSNEKMEVQSLGAARDEIRRLGGAAHTVLAVQAEAFLANVDELISIFLISEEWSLHLHLKLSNLLLKSVDLLWRLQELLAAGKTEPEAFENEQLAKLYNEIKDAANSFKFSMSI